jgi:hypothetical protein
MATRDELVDALAVRYGASDRFERRSILNAGASWMNSSR